jgi:hypothetical protein
MNVHHKCQDKVANLCGINQKLLAEALTQVSQVSEGADCVHVQACRHVCECVFLQVHVCVCVCVH